MASLRERLAEVRCRMERAAERAGRSPDEVTLVAVSKTMPAEVVMEAYHLGQRDFGENRVQEFQEKLRALDGLGPMPGVRWHLVGHLQTNKARLAAGLSDIIHSVDGLSLAQVLDRHAGAVGKRLPVLLEVDFSTEPQRSGFEIQGLEAVAGEMVGLVNLSVQGLMTVAPLGLGEEGLRAVFRRLRQERDLLAARHPEPEWRHLSMGMTSDFEIAIEEGATIVRIGRAIFGERPRP